MCTRCKRDKNEPKLWSDENNMNSGHVPVELSGMTDAERMLISRLAPTVHVHLLKHGGVPSRGHCIVKQQFYHVCQLRFTS